MKTFDMLVLMRVLYRQGLPVWESMAPVELAKIDAAADDILSGKPAPEPAPKKKANTGRRLRYLNNERRRVCQGYIGGWIAEDVKDQLLTDLDEKQRRIAAP